MAPYTADMPVTLYYNIILYHIDRLKRLLHEKVFLIARLGLDIVFVRSGIGLRLGLGIVLLRVKVRVRFRHKTPPT